MIEQVSTDVKFLAFFVATKVGKSGLADVTVDVYNPAGANIVAGAVAVAIGGGFYSYTLVGASTTAEGEYLAVFKTADATVDQQHIPALWVIGRAGVENLNAAVSTRSSHSAADVWTAVTRTLSAFSFLTNNGIADAVWDEALAGHVTAGTAGKLLNDIGTADIVTQGPVSADGSTLDLVRGDDYKAAENRQVTFSSASWPDLTDTGTDPVITMTVRRRAEAFGTGSDGVLFAVTDKVASRVVGVGTQTVVFELPAASTAALLPGTATGKYDVQAVLSSGSVITLVTGLVDVTEDQTR